MILSRNGRGRFHTILASHDECWLFRATLRGCSLSSRAASYGARQAASRTKPTNINAHLLSGTCYGHSCSRLYTTTGHIRQVGHGHSAVADCRGDRLRTLGRRHRREVCGVGHGPCFLMPFVCLQLYSLRSALAGRISAVAIHRDVNAHNILIDKAACSAILAWWAESVNDTPITLAHAL